MPQPEHSNLTGPGGHRAGLDKNRFVLKSFDLAPYTMVTANGAPGGTQARLHGQTKSRIQTEIKSRFSLDSGFKIVQTLTRNF